MKTHFKKHLQNLERVRSSFGRDLENGLFLDRNERVVNFTNEVIDDLFKQLPVSLLNTYPEPTSFYKKLSKFLNINEDKIFLTNGSTEGIKILYETLTNPGDRVVALSPTYPMYEVYSKIFQTEYRRFGFLEDFKIDIEGLFEEINNSTTLVCLPNPNLPVESNVGLHEIREVATKCKEHDAVLVVDEAYDMFGVSSSIDLINEYDNLVILRSFSKAFGLAGIRLGYVLSNAENIEYLSKTRSLVEASGPSMAIAEYMLDHSEIAKDYVCRVREGAKHLQGKLDKLGLRWYGGAYSNGLLVFLQDVPAVDDLISKMKKQKIYIRGSFEPPYDCCIRITIGPVEAMDSFFSIFENCLKSDNGY